MRKVSSTVAVVIVLLVFSELASFCSTAYADQGPPYPIARSFAHATAIVDATVRELTPKGAANIEIHQVLKGPKDVPTVILGSRDDTNRLIAASRDVKTGGRYILLLTENRLADYGFRGLHAFEVRKNDKGKLECHYQRFEPDANGRYSFSSRLAQSWEPLEDFKARIKKALDKKGG